MKFIYYSIIFLFFLGSFQSFAMESADLEKGLTLNDDPLEAPYYYQRRDTSWWDAYSKPLCRLCWGCATGAVTVITTAATTAYMSQQEGNDVTPIVTGIVVGAGTLLAGAVSYVVGEKIKEGCRKRC